MVIENNEKMTISHFWGHDTPVKIFLHEFHHFSEDNVRKEVREQLIDVIL